MTAMVMGHAVVSSNVHYELSGLGPARSADGLSAQLDLQRELGKVLLQSKVRWPSKDW